MAVSTENTITVSANGASDWIRLKRGKNRLLCSSADWSGPLSASVQYSDDATTVYLTDVNFGSNLLCESFDGPGYVRLSVSGYSSSPITFKVQHSLDASY